MFEERANINIGVNDEASAKLASITKNLESLEFATLGLTGVFKGLDAVVGAKSGIGKTVTSFFKDGDDKVDLVTKLDKAFKSISDKFKELKPLEKLGDKIDDTLKGFNKNIKTADKNLEKFVDDTASSLKNLDADKLVNTTSDAAEGVIKKSKKVIDDAVKTTTEGVTKLSNKVTEAFKGAGNQAAKTSTMFSKLAAVAWGLNQTIEKTTIALLGLKTIDTLTTAFDQLNRAVSNVNDSILLMANSGFDVSGFQQLDKVKSALFLNQQSAQEIAISSVTQFNRFSQSLAQVNTIMGAGKQELREYGIAIQDLVTNDLKNAVTSVDALSASYQALSAGFTTAGDSSNVMTAALKLSAGTQANSYTTVELLSKTLKAYSLDSSKAADTAAKLNAIVENGITTVDELSLNFGQAATVAANAGIKLEELGGALATLTTQGTSTQVALSGLQSLFRGIISGEYTERLAAYGIQFDANSIKVKGLSASLEEINAKLGGNKQKLQEVIQESQAFTTALGLVGEKATNLKGAIDNISNAGAAQLEKLFNVRIDTDQLLSFQQMVNRVGEIIIRIGRALTEAGIFDKGIEYLEKYTEKAEWMLKNFGGLLPVMIDLNIKFRAFNAVIGVLIGTVLKLIGIWFSYRAITGKIFGDIGALAIALTKNNLIMNKSMGITEKFGRILGQAFGRDSLKKYNEGLKNLGKSQQILADGTRVSKDITLQMTAAEKAKMLATLQSTNATKISVATTTAETGSKAVNTKATWVNVASTKARSFTTAINTKITWENTRANIANAQSLSTNAWSKFTAFLGGIPKLIKRASLKAFGKNTTKMFMNLPKTATKSLGNIGKGFGQLGKNIVSVVTKGTKSWGAFGKSLATLGSTTIPLVGFGLGIVATKLLGTAKNLFVANRDAKNFGKEWEKVTGVAMESNNLLARGFKALWGFLKRLTLLDEIFAGLGKVFSWVAKQVGKAKEVFDEYWAAALQGASKWTQVVEQIQTTTASIDTSSRIMTKALEDQITGGLSGIDVLVEGSKTSLGELVKDTQKSGEVSKRGLDRLREGLTEYKKEIAERNKLRKEGLEQSKQALKLLEQRIEKEKNNNRKKQLEAEAAAMKSAIKLQEDLGKQLEENAKQVIQNLEDYLTIQNRMLNKQGPINNPYYNSLKNQSKAAIAALEEDLVKMAALADEAQLEQARKNNQDLKVAQAELEALQAKDLTTMTDAEKEQHMKNLEGVQHRITELGKATTKTDKQVSEFDDNVGKVLTTTLDMVDAGFISAADGAELLREKLLANAGAIEESQLKELTEEIAALEKQASQDRIDLLEAENAVYEKMQSNRYFFSEENAKRQLDIEKQISKERVENARQRIRDLERQGVYTTEQMQQALDALALAEENHTQLVIEQEQKRFEIKEEYRNREIELINAQQDSIFHFTRENNQRLFELEKESIDEKIAAEESKFIKIQEDHNRKVTALGEQAKEAELAFAEKEDKINEKIEELRNKKKNYDDDDDIQKSIDKQIEEQEEQLKVIKEGHDLKQKEYKEQAEQSRKNVTEAEKEITRQIELLTIQRINIYKKELDEILEVNKERRDLIVAQGELELYEGERSLEQMKELNREARMRELEDQVYYYEELLKKAKEYGADTEELETKLAQAQVAIHKEKLAQVNELIDQQIARIKLATQQAELVAQRDLNANDRINRLLEVEKGLWETRKNYSQTIVDLNTRLMETGMQGIKSERRKKKLAKEIAEIKLRQIRFQIDMENKLLKIQRAQEKLALQREKIENRIAQVKQRAAILEAQAEAKKVLADPTKSAEEKVAALAQVEAAVEGLKGLQFEEQMLDLTGAITEQNQKIEDSLRWQQQQAQIMEGRLAVALTTGRKSDEKKIYEEMIKAGRNNLDAVAPVDFGEMWSSFTERFNIQGLKDDINTGGIYSGSRPAHPSITGQQPANNIQPFNSSIDALGNTLTNSLTNLGTQLTQPQVSANPLQYVNPILEGKKNEFSEMFNNAGKQITANQKANFEQYRDLLSQSPNLGSFIGQHGVLSDEFIDMMMDIKGDKNKPSAFDANTGKSVSSDIIPNLQITDPSLLNLPNIQLPEMKMDGLLPEQNIKGGNTVTVDAPITININSESDKQAADDLGNKMQDYLQDLVNEINRRI